MSSMYLNLVSLSILIKDNPDSIDGVLFLTSFGIVIGKLDDLTQEPETTTYASVLKNYKTKLIEKMNIESNNTIELVGDGSFIPVKDVIIKYSNNLTVDIDEFILCCDQITGFYPIKIADALNQFL
jgi:hypothetical protein